VIFLILKIKPQAPFNFDLSAKIFSNGDHEIQRYQEGVYWKLINLKTKLVFIELRSQGEVDNPELSLRVTADVHLTNKDISLVRSKVVSMFNLDFKLQNFYDDVKNDQVMVKIIRKLRGLNTTTTPTFFEAVVLSIIEQQISFKAAQAIQYRMIKEFGNHIKLGNKIYYCFPTVNKLSKLHQTDLRSCGLSFRKSEYIIDFSKEIIAGNINLGEMKKLKTSELIDKLLKIRGIGIWTAELSVLRGLHRLVALPADDLGIKRAVSHYYTHNEPVSSDDLLKIGINWGKWRGLAAYYLIRADLMSLKI
jgi:DNA-3-methyladenine glycosylase II